MRRISNEVVESGGSMSKQSFKSLFSCKTIKNTVLNELEIYQDELAHSLEASSFKHSHASIISRSLKQQQHLQNIKFEKESNASIPSVSLLSSI